MLCGQGAGLRGRTHRAVRVYRAPNATQADLDARGIPEDLAAIVE